MTQVQSGDRLRIAQIEQSSEERRQLDEREIYNVLRRLLKYYGGRASVSRARTRDKEIDAITLANHVTGLLVWESKHHAVGKVAENLGIEMEPAHLSVDEEQE